MQYVDSIRKMKNTNVALSLSEQQLVSGVRALKMKGKKKQYIPEATNAMGDD